MMRKLLNTVLLLILLPYGLLLAHTVDRTEQKGMKELFDKEEVTVLVTDSGLGGIAVCADIEQRLRSEYPFRSVKLIFCNALPESDYGYNMMGSTEEKIQVFSDALTGMTRWYAPDIILIACNTLSVLYDRTEYSRTATVPVISIVDIGVQMMADYMRREPSSSVIIFGTETTIEAESHKSLLMKTGIPASRIVQQACPDLAGEIQSDAASDAVGTMIGFYADDAAGKLTNSTGPVAASLCCTHYGYSAGQFREALQQRVQRSVDLIDPTQSMSNVLFPSGRRTRFAATHTSVTVISRATIAPQEVHSIAALIARQSPATAAALETFTLNKELFTYTRK